jgi:eukaryotic-like serine/threonine-protein kinase
MVLDQTLILTEEQSNALDGSTFKTILEDTKTVHNEHLEFDPKVLKELAEIDSSYDLGEKFAEGAQGEILTGTDKLLKRYVAIKSLKKDLLDQPGMVNSFVAEAIVTAQLDHPSIIPLYGINRDDKNGLHISMKLVHGQTLTDLIKSDRSKSSNAKTESLALTQRLEHFIRVCNAVAYAHEKKVIHRDLKPQNIMVGHFYEVYVMDWGIAQTYKEENRHIPQKTTAGTPGYIAPEILNKQLPEAASDQYSLAIILYELVCLKSALDDTDIKTRLKQTKAGKLPALKHFNPKINIHADLKAIFKKASDLNPQDRYTSATALADDIRQFIKKEEVTARPDNLLRKAYRFIAAHHHQAAAMFLFSMLVFAGITINSLTEQNLAVTSSKARELKLLDLRSNIISRSHDIDSHFQYLSSILERYTDKAVFLLESKNPSKHTILKDYRVFKNPNDLPSGTVNSPLYQQNINFAVGNYKLATGQSLTEVQETLNVISPLINDCFQYMSSSQKELQELTQQDLQVHATTKGFPIRWMYFGLKNGLLVNYPGSGVLTASYDPRERPWYKQNKDLPGVHWSRPYEDLFGLGTVISASMPMRNKKGNFLGVASFDLTLNDVKNAMVSSEENPSLIRSYLIDKEGTIIISSKDNMSGKTLPIPHLLNHIQEGRSGQFETSRAGQAIMVDHALIPTLSWYYIEEIDIDKYLKN